MIQIDMPMPKSCIDCPFKEQEYGEGECLADKENRCTYGDSSGRQEWCPLKEQEAVEPYVTGRGETFETAETWWYACGNCHEALGVNDKYCRHCGRPVKWE